jgi:hypothetical protein
MRQLLSALAAVVLSVALVGPAGAAALPFTGSLALQVATLDPIPLLGSGVAEVSGLDSHIGSLALSSAVFGAQGVVVPVSDPAAYPVAGVQLTLQNGEGTFSGSPLAGSLSIRGVARVCLFVACDAAPPANVSVPLSVIGKGGVTQVGSLVGVTVAGAGWTAGTAAVKTASGTVSAHGFLHGPASLTSSTAAASGAVRLVTPVVISTDIAGSAVIPAFAYLSLHFVPEPSSSLLLLGSAILGLVACGRSKRL